MHLKAAAMKWRRRVVRQWHRVVKLAMETRGEVGRRRHRMGKRSEAKRCWRSDGVRRHEGSHDGITLSLGGRCCWRAPAEQASRPTDSSTLPYLTFPTTATTCVHTLDIVHPHVRHRSPHHSAFPARLFSCPALLPQAFLRQCPTVPLYPSPKQRTPTCRAL